MSAHITNEDVIEEACASVGKLAEASVEARKLLCAAGACHALVKALSTNEKNTTIAGESSRAIAQVIRKLSPVTIHPSSGYW